MEKEFNKYTLPENWVWVELGEILETTSGGTPSRNRADYYGGNIPWVKSGELNYGIITKTEESITEEALRNSSAKLFPKGTLLIALYGATVGRLAFLGIEASTNQAVCGIFQNKNIDIKYIYYCLMYQYSFLISLSAGGAQPNISQTIIKKINIPLPPLPEQNRIVEKLDELLSELEKGREQLQVALSQLKVYRQAVLKWAFEGKLTNEGELQEEWKVVKLGDFLEKIEAGKSFKCDERTPRLNEIGVLKVSAVTWQVFNENESKTVTDKDKINERYFVEKGDFLFSRANTLDLIGAAVIVHSIERKLMLSDKTLRFIFTNGLLQIYVLYYLRCKKGRGEIQRLSTGNQESMRNIGQERIRQIEIPIPSIREQQLIVDELENKFFICDQIEETITQSLQQAETLKQSLLQQAFEGKLVPQDPDDEPASVLLERIKRERENATMLTKSQRSPRSKTTLA